MPEIYRLSSWIEVENRGQLLRSRSNQAVLSAM